MHKKLLHVASYNDRKEQLEEMLSEKLKHINHKCVIRMGGTKGYKEYPIQVNSAQSVKDSINKYTQKLIMLEGGLRTQPLLTQNITYPCIVKGVKRSRGSAVFIANNNDELEKAISSIKGLNDSGYMIEEFFDATDEYRLHCTKDKVFFEVKKCKRNDDIIIKANNHFNKRNFNRPPLWDEVKKECLKAINLLKLDICCFDVMYSSKNNTFSIAEANTSPELLRNTMNHYVDEIVNIVNSKIEQYENNKQEQHKLSALEEYEVIKMIINGNYAVKNKTITIKI